MKTITIRDLRSRPRALRKVLETEESAILTSNGRPFALMILIKEDDLESTLDTVRRVKAQQAIKKIRKAAVAHSLDDIEAAEIDALIAKTRHQE